MIGHEDNQGIFSLTGFFQNRENSANLMVNQGNHGKVSGADLPTVLIGHCLGMKFARLLSPKSDPIAEKWFYQGFWKNASKGVASHRP